MLMKRKLLVCILVAGAIFAYSGCGRNENETLTEAEKESILTIDINLSETDETVGDTWKKNNSYHDYWTDHPVSFDNCGWIIETDDGSNLTYLDNQGDYLLKFQSNNEEFVYTTVGDDRYLSVQFPGEDAERLHTSGADIDPADEYPALFEKCQKILDIDQMITRLIENPVLTYQKTVTIAGREYDILAAALDDAEVHREDDLGTEGNEVARSLPEYGEEEDEDEPADMPDNELASLTCYVSTEDRLLYFIEAEYGVDSSVQIALDYEKDFTEVEKSAYAKTKQADFDAIEGDFFEDFE